jgi:excisionase family DNA binding protein
MTPPGATPDPAAGIPEVNDNGFETIFGPALLDLLEELIDRRVDERIGRSSVTWLTPAQVGDRLGLSRRQVYRLLDSDEIPSTRWGTARRVKESDLG